jgi:ADP-heptose:LPS heptosyltransferase
MLSEEKYNIIFAGTEKEALKYRKYFLNLNRNIKDAGGKLTLEQYIALISNCDGLLAASTGPLHISAILGKHAFGIYPPIRPMHPGRWAPIGKNIYVFVKNIKCSDCRKSKECKCINDIQPEEVKCKILQVFS